MKAEEFCGMLRHRPKWVSKAGGADDGVQVAEFRRRNGRVATLEFGRMLNKEKGGYYFYFEVLDLSGYKDGDFIPLDSGRRETVIASWPRTDENYKDLAAEVDKALSEMYRAKKGGNR